MDEESLAQICSVTGADVDAARHLLEAADGDVNLAISLFFDSSSTTAVNNRTVEEPEVRAPIAPQRTRITTSDGMNVQPTLSFHIPEPFAASARENPENPTAARLAALYKPPTELVHQPATLEAARSTARSRDVPLLVSLYDPTIFPCHVENRDVWSNGGVRDFIQSGHVVFLQLVYNGGPLDQGRGELYAGRYRVQPPHIGIIDPQTGELLREFKTTPDPMDLLSTLSDYIQDESAAPLEETVKEEEEAVKEATYEEPDAGPDVTNIMFRLRDGRRVPKRFLHSSTASVLYKVAAQLSECRVDDIILKPSPHDSINPEATQSLKELGLANSLITITGRT